MKDISKYFLMFFILLVITSLLIGCSEDLVDYEVIEVDDSNIDDIKRYEYFVLVKEEATKDDLLNIGKEVIEQAKEETPFNALIVSFYDYPEFIGHGYPLGKIEYVPYGDFSEAMKIETGDYKKMEIVDDLKEKDWSKQLTEDEVKKIEEWNNFYNKKALEMDGDVPNEDDITKEVSEEFGITFEKMEEIINKYINWLS